MAFIRPPSSCTALTSQIQTPESHPLAQINRFYIDKVLLNGKAQGLYSQVYCSISTPTTYQNLKQESSSTWTTNPTSSKRIVQRISCSLTRDLKGFFEYYKDWRLIPNSMKTIVICFHLSNREVTKTLDIQLNGVILPHDFEPKFFDVTRDRSLTQHKKQTDSTF